MSEEIRFHRANLRGMESGSEAVNQLIRVQNRKAVRNVVIGETVLSVVWGILGSVIPSGGTLMALVNIAFLLFSLFLGWAMAMALRFRFSPFMSGILAAVVWILIFGVLRGFF